jgi:hypothetical protein
VERRRRRPRDARASGGNCDGVVGPRRRRARTRGVGVSPRGRRACRTTSGRRSCRAAPPRRGDPRRRGARGRNDGSPQSRRSPTPTRTSTRSIERQLGEVGRKIHAGRCGPTESQPPSASTSPTHARADAARSSRS